MPWLYNPNRRRLEYRDAQGRIVGWAGGQQSDTSDLLPTQQMQRLTPPEDVRALADAAIAGDPNAVAPLLSQLQKIAPQYEQLDIQAAQQNGSLAGTSAYAQDPAYLRAQLGLVQSALRNTASKDDLDARRRTLQERARLLGVTLPPLPQNSPTAAPGSPTAGGTPQGGSSEQGTPNQAAPGQGGTPPGGFTTAMMQDPEYLAIYQAEGDTAVAAHLYGEKRKLDEWERLLDSHELNQKQWAPLLEGERAKQKAPEKFAEQRRSIMARWNGQNTEEIQRALQELSWQEQAAMGELDEGIASARNAIFPGMNQTMDRAYAAGQSDVKGTPGVVRYKDLAPHQRAALFGAAHAATGGASSADPNYQPDLDEEEQLARLPRFAAGGQFGGSNFGAPAQFGGTNFSGGTGYTPGAPVNVPAAPNPATGYGANPYGSGNAGQTEQQPPTPTSPTAGADYQRQLDAIARERQRIQDGITSSLESIAAGVERQMFALQQERARVQQQFEQRRQSILQEFSTRAWALYEERNQIVADNPFIAQRAPGEVLQPGNAPSFPTAAATGASGLPSLAGFI